MVAAIQKQAQHLLHASNLYYTEPQVRLAQALVDHSFAKKVFFCNSGAEANEAAIKLARRYAHEKYGPDRYEIITMLQSFHGRTLASEVVSKAWLLHDAVFLHRSDAALIRIVARSGLNRFDPAPRKGVVLHGKTGPSPVRAGVMPAGGGMRRSVVAFGS